MCCCSTNRTKPFNKLFNLLNTQLDTLLQYNKRDCYTLYFIFLN